jgi:hypothetical protein
MHSVILASAAVLVPRADRGEWLQDWKAELWYVKQASAHAPRVALLFCLGAFHDALWMQWDALAARARRGHSLESPLQCLTFLGTLAMVMVSGLFYRPWLAKLESERGFLPGAFLMMAMSLLVLPAVVPFDFGKFSLKSASRFRAAGLRRWTFFSAKFALAAFILFGAFFYLMMVPQVALFGADLMMFVCVLAFRWVVRDQRRRCPVCLRALTGETRVAKPFRMFQEWYGSRHFCPQGHGSLYVPQADAASAAGWSDRTPDVLGPTLL